MRYSPGSPSTTATTGQSAIRWCGWTRPRPLRGGGRAARLLAAHDCAGLEELFQAFFASIPYEWHADRVGTSNDIANYEGYYASVFYSHFAALG